MVDALAASKRLAELDHRTFADDAASELQKLATLPKRKGRFDWLDDLDDADEVSTEDFLGRTAKQLAPEKLTLIILDLDTDAFPVVVVPTQDAAKVISLAKAAGGKAERVAPLAQVAKAKPTAPADDDVEIPVWRAFLRGEEAWLILQGATLIDTDGGTLGGPTSFRSEAVGEGKTAAEARRRIAEKRAEGFVEIAVEEYRRLDAAATTPTKKKR